MNDQFLLKVSRNASSGAAASLPFFSLMQLNRMRRPGDQAFDLPPN
jgi:hypothetical protein